MKRRRDESGVTVIEFVILTPILFLLMFGSVQIGLALFARHVAVSAAQEGARTAREEAENNADWGSDADGAASRWVTQLLGGLVQGAPDPHPDNPVPLGEQYPEVGTTMTFTIVTVIPGWDITVSATSIGPVECFYDIGGFCDG